MSLVAWDDRPSTADTDQHDDSGICPSCGDWYPASHYTQEGRELLPEDAGFQDGDREIPLNKCCDGCIDYYFACLAPCVQITADGSYELA